MSQDKKDSTCKFRSPITSATKVDKSSILLSNSRQSTKTHHNAKDIHQSFDLCLSDYKRASNQSSIFEKTVASTTTNKKTSYLKKSFSKLNMVLNADLQCCYKSFTSMTRENSSSKTRVNQVSKNSGLFTNRENNLGY